MPVWGDMPDPIIILVRKDGTLDGVPAKLDPWRSAMGDFVAAHADRVAAIDLDHSCIIRARLIEIEQPTLILQLCIAPSWAVKSYNTIG
jgi:hypothetical protein